MTKKISINSSKAISPDFAGSFIDNKGNELPPKTNLEKYSKLLEDVDVATAVHKFVDALFYTGYTITYPNDSSSENISASKKLLKHYSFPRILRQIAVNAKIYQKAFVELVKKPMSVNGVVKKVVTELHVLHTPTIIPIIDQHGEVKQYVQRVGGKEVRFNPEDIVEIQILPSTASYWGFYDIIGLWEVVMTKELLEDYVDFLFRNGKTLPYWSTEQQISKDAYNKFVDGLKKQKNNPAGELIAQGKIKREFFERFQFLEDIENYINHLRGKIFEFFGVPPIAAGFIEGANRSSADTQVRYVWNNSVLAFKRVLEYELNYELFPKIGIRAEIHFNPFDRLDIKDRIENALKLRALGTSNDTIEHLLKFGVLPEEITWETPQLNNDKRVNDKITNLTAPSRQPRDPNNKVIRTGSESTTREDQIFGK